MTDDRSRIAAFIELNGPYGASVPLISAACGISPARIIVGLAVAGRRLQPKRARPSGAVAVLVPIPHPSRGRE